MAGPDFSEELKSIDATMVSVEKVLDLPALRQQASELEEQSAAPDLWNDPEAAQKVTSKLAHLQGNLRKVDEIRRRIDDLAIMWELAEAEDDAATRAESEAELEKLKKDVEAIEVTTLLNGEYDPREALVTVRA